jgi:RNA polymerase sigma factor (sigma-70 family)
MRAAAITITPPVPRRRRTRSYSIPELTSPDAARIAKWAIKGMSKKRRCARRRFMDNADILQDAMVHLLQYKPPREWKLSTVVCNAVEWVTLRHVGRLRHCGRLVGESAVELVDIETEHYFSDSLDIRESIDAALRMVPARCREMIVAYYFAGESMVQIGKRYRVSGGAISQCVLKGLARIRETSPGLLQYIEADHRPRSRKPTPMFYPIKSDTRQTSGPTFTQIKRDFQCGEFDEWFAQQQQETGQPR